MADKSESLLCFQSLFTRKFDVTLICEGKEIRAPKSVLFNSCPYLESRLAGNFPENKGDVIKVDKTSYDVLTVVVNYATFKQFAVKDWDMSTWKQLFLTAHEYHFQGLLQHASEVFDVNEFDLLTIFEAFPLFIKLGLTQVIDKFWSHVDTYAKKLINVKNRPQFLAWPQAFVEALVQRENLNVSEAGLLNAISAWLQQHPHVDPDNILIHIHWNEISDSDPRKKLWLGWSEDTSYKDKKPRCLSVPQTFQRYILPDYNVAQYGASEALLQKSDNQFASPAYQDGCTQHIIDLSRPFAINTIKFRLNTTQHVFYTVNVSTTDRSIITVTHANMSGCSYQELYFEAKIVSRIYISSSYVAVNSLECMYSSNIPALRDSYVIAEKNMLLSDMDATAFSLQHINYKLLQKCYVSSLALYLGCDDDHQFELYDHNDAIQIPLTKLSVVNDGFLRVVVLQFEEVLLDRFTVKSKDGIIHIVRAECPASRYLISSAGAIESD